MTLKIKEVQLLHKVIELKKTRIPIGIEEIKFPPGYVIDKVSSYFNMRKEEMACYKRKKLRKR